MTAHSSLITDYLGYGTHAARPATPNVGSGVAPIYYETDTGNTFAWSGSAWVQLNGTGGGNTAYSLAQGRLTLTTALAVTTADVTAAGTLYWTPYKGDQIGLYDGAGAWTVLAFAETSLSLTLTSGKPYDIFAYNNSGTLALEALVWTSDSARATALVLQNGIPVKSGATTRRYLGTIYASGTNTTEDSAANRYVWNYYNRVRKPLQVIDTTDSWTYASATWREARGQTTNQVQLVIGVAEDAVSAWAKTSGTGGSGIAGAVGIGLDSTSANSAQLLTDYSMGAGGGSATNFFSGDAFYRGFPAAGKHYLAWLEYARAGTITLNGDGAVVDMQNGLQAEVMC